MRVNLPRTDHPLTKVTASAGNWTTGMYAGRPYRDCEIKVPAEIDEAEVEVVAEPCDRKGTPVERIVIKVGKPKSVVQTRETSEPVTQSAESAAELKPRKKRAKRGHEIAPPVESTELDNTRSQVNVGDDERDAG